MRERKKLVHLHPQLAKQTKKYTETITFKFYNFKNNVNGIIVPVHDENALAEKMIYLADNSDKAEILGAQAKQIIYDLNENMIAQKWCDYIRSVVCPCR